MKGLFKWVFGLSFFTVFCSGIVSAINAYDYSLFNGIADILLSLFGVLGAIVTFARPDLSSLPQSGVFAIFLYWILVFGVFYAVAELTFRPMLGNRATRTALIVSLVISLVASNFTPLSWITTIYALYNGVIAMAIIVALYAGSFYLAFVSLPNSGFSNHRVILGVLQTGIMLLMLLLSIQIPKLFLLQAQVGGSMFQVVVAR